MLVKQGGGGRLQGGAGLNQSGVLVQRVVVLKSRNWGACICFLCAESDLVNHPKDIKKRTLLCQVQVKTSTFPRDLICLKPCRQKGDVSKKYRVSSCSIAAHS